MTLTRCPVVVASTRIAHPGSCSGRCCCCLAWPGLAWLGLAASDPRRYLDLTVQVLFFFIYLFLNSHDSPQQGRICSPRRAENILISPFTFSLRTPSSHGYLMDTASGPSAPSPHSIVHSGSLPPAHSRQPTPAWGIIFEHLRRQEGEEGERRCAGTRTWISQEEPSLSNGSGFLKKKKRVRVHRRREKCCRATEKSPKM